MAKKSRQNFIEIHFTSQELDYISGALDHFRKYILGKWMQEKKHTWKAIMGFLHLVKIYVEDKNSDRYEGLVYDLEDLIQKIRDHL